MILVLTALMRLDPPERETMCDPNSFRGKVSLAIIDKLVLGLLAALIIFAVQQCSDSAEEARQARLNVSRIQSTLITDTISAVRNKMNNYFAISNSLIISKITANPVQSNLISSSTDEIELLLFTIESLIPFEIFNKSTKSISKDSTYKYKITSSIANLNQLLRSQVNDNMSPSRSAEIEIVFSEYRVILGALRDAAIRAVDSERNTR